MKPKAIEKPEQDLTCWEWTEVLIVNRKNPNPGQHEDNKTDSEIRKYFLKDAHIQLFVRFSFKLFIIVDVDKINSRSMLI